MGKYRRFGLEVIFEASWFVLLGGSNGASATIAFMHPDHPSAPPGPEPFTAKGMCLEFQVVGRPTARSLRGIERCSE